MAGAHHCRELSFADPMVGLTIAERPDSPPPGKSERGIARGLGDLRRHRLGVRAATAAG